MATAIEYALMAGASYYDTRRDINRFPIPSGWNLVSRNPQDNATGFEAATFGNGARLKGSASHCFCITPSKFRFAVGSMCGMPRQHAGMVARLDLDGGADVQEGAGWPENPVGGFMHDMLRTIFTGEQISDEKSGIRMDAAIEKVDLLK